VSEKNFPIYLWKCIFLPVQRKLVEFHGAHEGV
jgi:hypothetical protein